MAYITVVSTTNSIQVNFGVYSGYQSSSGLIPKKRTIQKNSVVCSLIADDTYVEVQTNNSFTFPVSFDGSTGTFKVDSVDGVAPLSNSDLYDKIQAIIA